MNLLIMQVSLEHSLLVPERYSQAASHWFPRAGRHVIDLEIIRRRNGNHTDRFSANFIIQLVWPRVERTRSLSLSLPGVDTMCDFLCHQDDEGIISSNHVWSFPNLENLTLTLNSYHGRGADLPALRSLPKLRAVELNDVFSSDQLDIYLSWA